MELTRNERRNALTLSIVTCAVVLSPVVKHFGLGHGDSFPLSTYPMFAEPRRDHERVNHVVGITATGDSVPITFHMWAVGAAGMNAARSQIDRKVRKGHADDLCVEAATAVARSRRKKLKKVVEIQVLTSVYSLEQRYRERDVTPVTRTVRASCPVVRSKR